MSRPKAQTLLSTQIDDFNGIEILAATSLYTVLYKQQPINIKNKYWSARGEFNKYTKTTYPNKKPAENLAKKLNELFFTTDFTVAKIL
jgi:hypothetical protein